MLNGAVHASATCTLTPSQSPTMMSLREIIALEPKHDCVLESLFTHPDHKDFISASNARYVSLNPRYILEILEKTTKLSPWEEVRNFESFTSASLVDLSLDPIFRAFYQDKEELLPPLIMDYMHHNLGCPKTPQEIFAVYMANVERISEDNLSAALRTVSLSDTSGWHSSDEIFESFQEQLQRETSSSSRVIVALEDPDGPTLTSSSFGFSRAVIDFTVQKFNKEKTALVALPPLLAEAARRACLTLYDAGAKPMVNHQLSVTEMLTAYTLFESGMRLDEAVLSAQKLN